MAGRIDGLLEAILYFGLVYLIFMATTDYVVGTRMYCIVWYGVVP